MKLLNKVRLIGIDPLGTTTPNANGDLVIALSSLPLMWRKICGRRRTFSNKAPSTGLSESFNKVREKTKGDYIGSFSRRMIKIKIKIKTFILTLSLPFNDCIHCTLADELWPNTSPYTPHHAKNGTILTYDRQFFFDSIC